MSTKKRTRNNDGRIVSPESPPASGTCPDQPDMAEGIAEAALPVDSPWGLVLANRVMVPSAPADGATHEVVGVVDEDLDSDRGVAAQQWADESRVCRLVEEEGRIVDP